ncbi:MAG: hypothetical protein KAQ98_10435 [Bacteriovoracaceae bacterium]|nr:hypothetical protein [Bacteriovoracaceae bacterium]
MKFRRIENVHELNHFQKLTQSYIDVLLPLEYLKRSKVIICENKHGEICGGFVIVMKGPFRVIDSIPEFDHESWKNKLKDTAEITGLWLDSDFSKRTSSLKFWLKVYSEMILTRKKYFTYAWSLKKPKLGEIYSHANPTVLFRGATKILPGMKEADNESVELVRRTNLVLTPFVKPSFILKRLKGGRSLKEHNQHKPQIVGQ